MTNGNINIKAEGSADVSSSTTIPDTIPNSTSILFSMNVVRGDVDVYIEESSIQTLTSGNIFLDADNTATVDALMSAEPADLPTSTFSAGIVLNAVGWDLGDVLGHTVDFLLGDSKR